MTHTVPIQRLPSIVTACDYHDFYLLNSQFGEIGLSLKAKEIGFSDGLYVAVVYSEKFPSQDEIRNLLDEKQIVLED